jgi:hypothetical protein
VPLDYDAVFFIQFHNGMTNLLGIFRTNLLRALSLCVAVFLKSLSLGATTVFANQVGEFIAGNSVQPTLNAVVFVFLWKMRRVVCQLFQRLLPGVFRPVPIDKRQPVNDLFAKLIVQFFPGGIIPCFQALLKIGAGNAAGVA